MQEDRTALPRHGALGPGGLCILSIPVSILCLVNEFLFPGRSNTMSGGVRSGQLGGLRCRYTTGLPVNNFQDTWVARPLKGERPKAPEWGLGHWPGEL